MNQKEIDKRIIKISEKLRLIRKVLGIPFVLDGLYSEPAMFQINDKCQIVIREWRECRAWNYSN